MESFIVPVDSILCGLVEVSLFCLSVSVKWLAVKNDLQNDPLEPGEGAWVDSMRMTTSTDPLAPLIH